MSALYEAYAEYLERMLLQSDDLADVDVFSVPPDEDGLNWPVLEEWGTFS